MRIGLSTRACNDVSPSSLPMQGRERTILEKQRQQRHTCFFSSSTVSCLDPRMLPVRNKPIRNNRSHELWKA